MKESFPTNSIEEIPEITPQEQEVAVLEEENRNIDLYADTILNAAKKNGYNFLVDTLSQLEKYAKGEHDEQRKELFEYWSNEELHELHEKINQKIKEELKQSNQ